MSTTAIRLEGINKDFDAGGEKVRVLHDIHLEIASGALTMLVGPSGCGKTTLLSIMTGILKPTEGNVHIHDTEITALSDRANVLFRRKNLGFIFQQYNLLPTLTAAENAAIPLLADSQPWNTAIARGKAMLETVGLGPHTEKLPRQLSGGQQQRVAIARALVHQPILIVCDEPTSALDATTGHQIMSMVRAIAVQPNAAVVVVTHDNRIFNFADKIIQMNDGHLES